MAGCFPATEAGLRALPGIGDYTAAAIAAIAFGARATPVDGNIERVVARLFAIATPLPDAKTEIRALAQSLTPENRAGDFAQAVMDLGATLCTPRRPGVRALSGEGRVSRLCAKVSPKSFPIARRRASARCGAGSPSSRFARTALCCSASGR